MCRFALIRNPEPISAQENLRDFSTMAQVSRAPDGDIQGDGWGISGHYGNRWKKHSSVNPIWESTSQFSLLPNSNLFLIHARSASFVQDKNNVNFNQPYTSGNYSFVFNGLLKGIIFPRPLKGSIGAQKIWSLLQEYLDKEETVVALKKTIAELNQHTKEVQALNLGLSDGKKLYVYCQFSGNDQYYTLHVSQSAGKTIVSSEPFNGGDFIPLEPGKLHVF